MHCYIYANPAFSEPWADAREAYIPADWRNGGTPAWRQRMEELWISIDQDTRDVERAQERMDAELKLRTLQALGDNCPCRDLPTPPEAIEALRTAVDGRNAGTGNGVAATQRDARQAALTRQVTCPFVFQCPHHAEVFGPLPQPIEPSTYTTTPASLYPARRFISSAVDPGFYPERHYRR